MLSVYLCDDNNNELSHFTKIVLNYLLFKDWNMNFGCSTTNPHELIEKLRENKDTGVYFLDVDLNLGTDYNGFTLAAEIRRLDPRGFIIFITSHGEMGLHTFQYHLEVMDYILKDKPTEVIKRIEECLADSYSKYVKLQEHCEDVFIVKKQSNTIYLKMNDILYLQTSISPHQIQIFTKTQILSIYDTLTDCERNLSADFLRCHKSYLVNKKHIIEIRKRKKELVIDNGDILAITSAALKHLK